MDASVVHVEGLRKTCGSTVAVDDIPVEVAEAEIFAVGEDLLREWSLWTIDAGCESLARTRRCSAACE